MVEEGNQAPTAKPAMVGYYILGRRGQLGPNGKVSIRIAAVVNHNWHKSTEK